MTVRQLLPPSTHPPTGSPSPLEVLEAKVARLEAYVVLLEADVRRLEADRQWWQRWHIKWGPFFRLWRDQ